MSSISANPNPNSESSMINQPSSPNSPNKPDENEAQQDETRNPNWLELPEDVWFTILSRLKTIAIIENVQKFCMLFRKLCMQPAMFNTIDMHLSDAYMDLPYDVNVMTRFAVDRSSGVLVDISFEDFCDDDTLMYIVDRSKNLKRLVLQHYINVSDETLIEAVQKLPMLEELQLIICRFSVETVRAIGLACPSLKSFSLNGVGSKKQDCSEFGNEDARAIATSMPQLRHLQLIGSRMTNDGLKAILDGCPLLESLDLRACFHINLSGGLGKRCEKIKLVRYPNDSMKDYGWQACAREHNTAAYKRQSCSRDYKISAYERGLESEYDSDDNFMFRLYPDILDLMDFEEDEYDDFFREDEDFRDYCDYFRGGGSPGSASFD